MISDCLPRRGVSLAQTLMSSTAVGAALSCMLAMPAYAQSAQGQQIDTGIMSMPTISVEAEAEGDYKVDSSASNKFTAPLLDTPKSVTIIPQELIEEQNATSLQEVLRTTPGITLGAGEGGVPNADLPNIRGFAAEGNIYVDGLRDPGSQTRSTFNLEQVEVVKGPGSAFAGRGSTGGSINLVTKKPKAETFFAGSASIGAPLSTRATADGNYVVSDKMALRLNVMAEDGEVAGRDEVETSSWGIAPSLTVGLTDSTRATVSFYHVQTDDMPDYSHPYDTATGRPAVVDRDNFYGLTNRDFQETQADVGTVEIEHEIDERFTVRNITRYGWSENDFIVTNPDDSAGNVANGMVWRNVKSRNADTTTMANQTDLSGEFMAWDMRHSVNLGVEFSREETRNRGYSVDTGNRDCSVTGIGAPSNYNCTSLYDPDPNDPWTGSISPSSGSSKTETETQSIYAFNTTEITPQWLVNFGLRFDNYQTEAQSTGGRGGPFNGENDTSFINYQAGVVYKPQPNGSIYVNYGTSSDPSGTTTGEGRDNLGSANANLDPEESRSYELGTKWEVFDRKLALSAAIFRTDKTNARVDDPLGGPSDVLEGEQRVQGFELGVAGAITDRWRVFGGYTHLNSEIVDDGIGTDDGNELPNVPKHSLSVWTTYDVLPQWTVGGGPTYMSSRYGNTANTRSVPDFWRFDAVVKYAFTETIDFQLNANNIFDATYYEKPYTTHFATVGAGRSVMLTVNFKY